MPTMTKENLLDAAWRAASYLSSNYKAGALDERGRHSLEGLTALMILTLTKPETLAALGKTPMPGVQIDRIAAYWIWWTNLWNYYYTVIDRIHNGEAAIFDPSVPGKCPYTIRQLSDVN